MPKISRRSFSSAGSMLLVSAMLAVIQGHGRISGPQTASQKWANKSPALTFAGTRDLSASKRWRREQD
ncbi:hypothetical protein PBY51_014760 [Eleginops maclovinus]|uniref:Uncharacterized protein n=1 Tax=Eleginops maclovinus TaxID=56733 RepID=A0AAN7X3J1_ELEMC|nr:hypothetical protein PBY51_014760 [Eleginops maclovinus]